MFFCLVFLRGTLFYSELPLQSKEQKNIAQKDVYIYIQAYSTQILCNELIDANRDSRRK